MKLLVLLPSIAYLIFVTKAQDPINITPAVPDNTMNLETTLIVNPETPSTKCPETAPTVSPEIPTTSPEIPILVPETHSTMGPEIVSPAGPETAPTMIPETPSTMDPETTPVVGPEIVSPAGPETAPTMNPEIASTMGPEIVSPVGPETAPTMNPETASTMNPLITPVIDPETTPTMGPEIVTPVGPETAPTMNPETESTMGPEIIITSFPESTTDSTSTSTPVTEESTTIVLPDSTSAPTTEETTENPSTTSAAPVESTTVDNVNGNLTACQDSVPPVCQVFAKLCKAPTRCNGNKGGNQENSNGAMNKNIGMLQNRHRQLEKGNEVELNDEDDEAVCQWVRLQPHLQLRAVAAKCNRNNAAPLRFPNGGHLGKLLGGGAPENRKNHIDCHLLEVTSALFRSMCRATCGVC